jgi:hypothetical protein
MITLISHMSVVISSGESQSQCHWRVSGGTGEGVETLPMKSDPFPFFCACRGRNSSLDITITTKKASIGTGILTINSAC